MRKVKQGKERLEELIKQCENSFTSWNEIHSNGCRDPNWADGVNLNLVRNHIIYEQKEIERLCEEQDLEKPPILLRGVPEKISNDYVANKEQILSDGQKFLEQILADPTYQEFNSIYRLLSPTQKEYHLFKRLVNEICRLKIGLEKKDAVLVRIFLYRQQETFDLLPAVLSAAESMPVEPHQISLFDIA